MINETPEWAIKAARTVIGLMAKSVQKALNHKNAMNIPEEAIETNAKIIYLEYQKAKLEELEDIKEANNV